MEGRHEKIYRGFVIVVDLISLTDGTTRVTLSSRDLATGEPGPADTCIRPSSLDLLLDAYSRAEDAIDASRRLGR